MEEASGQNLQTFFKQWLYQPINPTINATWEYNAKTKKITIQVQQTQLGDMVFTIPVEIGYYKEGSTTPTILKMNVTTKEQTQTFTVKNTPDKLEFDPRNVLLCKSSLVKK